MGDLEAKIGKKVAKSEKWNLIVYEELNEQGSLPSELPWRRMGTNFHLKKAPATF